MTTQARSAGAPRRRSGGVVLRSHLKRSAVEVVNFVLNHTWFFRIIGWLNSRTGKLASVFLVYPATREYALSAAYPRRLAKNRWTPWPTGIMRQDGKIVLMVAVSATDEDIRAPDSSRDLERLRDAVERLRALVRAERKSFAGVLPGVMHRRGLLETPSEREVTARVVCQAVEQLAADDSGQRIPVIVLGGGGFIGRRMVEILDENFECYSLDVLDGRDAWPTHLQGRPSLLVNVANRQALNGVEDKLWSGMVVLNEVYPEPSRRLRADLAARGIAVHHVVGVAGSVFPRLPNAYRGAIPCCAAWPSRDAQVVTRSLNEPARVEPTPIKPALAAPTPVKPTPAEPAPVKRAKVEAPAKCPSAEPPARTPTDGKRT